jgi:transposase-like protein
MTCHYCHTACKRFGRHRNGLQRFRCTKCGKTLTEEYQRPLDDMRLPIGEGAVLCLRFFAVLLIGDEFGPAYGFSPFLFCPK